MFRGFLTSTDLRHLFGQFCLQKFCLSILSNMHSPYFVFEYLVFPFSVFPVRGFFGSSFYFSVVNSIRTFCSGWGVPDEPYVSSVRGNISLPGHNVRLHHSNSPCGQKDEEREKMRNLITGWGGANAYWSQGVEAPMLTDHRVWKQHPLLVMGCGGINAYWSQGVEVPMLNDHRVWKCQSWLITGCGGISAYRS